VNFSFSSFLILDTILVERFHSRGQHLCKFIGKKESVYTKNEFNSYRNGLKHQNGRYGIVLENQFGHRDVMCKRSLYFQRNLATYLTNLVSWNNEDKIKIMRNHSFYEERLSCRRRSVS